MSFQNDIFSNEAFFSIISTHIKLQWNAFISSYLK